VRVTITYPLGTTFDVTREIVGCLRATDKPPCNITASTTASSFSSASCNLTA
jgi:hypothetical protein